MSLHHHSLLNEFPEYREQIHQLKMQDAHFGRLFAEYDEVEHNVYRIESGTEAASDERLEALKRQRLQLKDTLYGYLRNTAA